MKKLPKILADNFSRPRIHTSGQGVLARPASAHSHVRLVAMIVFAVFVCEALIMFILSYLPVFPTWLQALIDATLLVFLLSPVLYFGLFRTLV